MIAAIRSDDDFIERYDGLSEKAKIAFFDALAIEKLAERDSLKELMDHHAEHSPGSIMTGPGWAKVRLAELDDWEEVSLQVCPGWAFVSVGREFHCENVRLSARAGRQLQEHFGIEPDPEACRA